MDGHAAPKTVDGAATVGIHEAKTTLSKLVARVEAGEEIVLTRGGVPVARIAPLRGDAPPRGVGSGAWKDMPPVDPEVFAPMTDEELDEAFGPGVFT